MKVRSLIRTVALAVSVVLISSGITGAWDVTINGRPTSDMDNAMAVAVDTDTGVTGRPLSSAIRAPPFEILRDRARRCGKIGSPMSKWGKKHGYPPCIRGAP